MQTCSDYHRLFLAGVPMLDVRAPVEFARGAFPNSTNAPIMNDAEREAVGTCYVQQGQAAAIDLGHQLVSGATKAARVAAWVDFAKSHPDGVLYCFRGGLRSQIAQRWLNDAGVSLPRVHGGYKAMRNELLGVLTQAVTTTPAPLLVLGGLTGSGKTDLLAHVANAIDLEAHAHHRGSGFGAHATAQPSQIDFENRMAIDILRKHQAGHTRLVVEDEGRFIGSCGLPPEWRTAMAVAPLVWLEVNLTERVDRILQDYVIDQHHQFVAVFGPQNGFDLFASHLRGGLQKIARRLGGSRHHDLLQHMNAALADHPLGRFDRHRDWITTLLTDYYDPMYAYQKDRNASRVVFSGDAKAVLAWLQNQAVINDCCVPER
jgi:tRNA 2-selenouridine synthase